MCRATESPIYAGTVSGLRGPRHAAARDRICTQEVKTTFGGFEMFVEKLSNTRQVALGRLFIAALAILLLSASAQAGFITIDPAGMNAIFSQESFGDTPISIRFDPAIQIVAPQLLVINTPADEQALLNLAPDPAPTVDAFFVDQINRCDQ